MRAVDSLGNVIDLPKGTIFFPANLPYSLEEWEKKMLKVPLLYLLTRRPAATHADSLPSLLVEAVQTSTTQQGSIVKKLASSYAVFVPS